MENTELAQQNQHIKQIKLLQNDYYYNNHDR